MIRSFNSKIKETMTNKSNWNRDKINALYNEPFFDLLKKSHLVHLENFLAKDMEFCVLSSIKTGLCPEDCAYCPQSAHYKTQLETEKLISIDNVIQQAKSAKELGVKRFCMGAAWRKPPIKAFPLILKMISAVKKIGLETCVTLGMLDLTQAKSLKGAGLDYYNHNLDTSPEYYKKIITTRTFQHRLDTITNVIAADINVCCGGIIGMGESREDRINFLLSLYQLPKPPASIPINKLIAIKGTPLENTVEIDELEFIRTIAITRLIFPQSRIRLSAGRYNMTKAMQAWCYMAGANSIFLGEKLLTAQNKACQEDKDLMQALGYQQEVP